MNLDGTAQQAEQSGIGYLGIRLAEGARELGVPYRKLEASFAEPVC
jgi:hypothetical protein